MSARVESPSEEMQRLIRKIAGAATAGERDPQLIARARRRLNMDLGAGRQISERRAKTYWYGEAETVPSHHMDRARELAFVQPLDEAIHAIEHAEAFLEGLRRRLSERCRFDRRGSGVGRDLGHRRRASDFPKSSTRVPPFDPARLKGLSKLTS